MRGWSLKDSLVRVSAPALVMFAGWTALRIIRRESGEGISDIVVWNAVLFALIWIAVSVVMWVLVPKAR